MKVEDVAEMTVNQMRDILVDHYDFTQEDAYAIKGKRNVREILEESIRASEGESIIGDPQQIITEDDIEESSPNIPDMTSEDWSDYVMTLFSDDEVMEKDGNRYPTLKGLRRVAANVLGFPIFSGIIGYNSPESDQSPGRAHANYELAFIKPMSDVKIIYRGAADAYSGNIAGGYHVYPLAIAENRAEARAYRKALMLNIVTAEEIGNESSEFTSVLHSSGEYNENSSISEEQKAAIKKKVKDFSVDFDKFLEFMKKELKTESLSKKDGVECVKKVSYFSNNPNEIPEELKL